MIATGSAELKLIKDGGNQQGLLFPDVIADGSLCHLGENTDFVAIRICGADLDGDIFCCLLVDSQPHDGKRAVAELVYYSISFVKSIVDVKRMIAAQGIVTSFFDSLNAFVLDRRCWYGRVS